MNIRQILEDNIRENVLGVKHISFGPASGIAFGDSTEKHSETAIYYEDVYRHYAGQGHLKRRCRRAYVSSTWYHVNSFVHKHNVRVAFKMRVETGYNSAYKKHYLNSTFHRSFDRLVNILERLQTAETTEDLESLPKNIKKYLHYSTGRKVFV